MSKCKKFGCIYLIQNIQNKKIYIGKTTYKNPVKYIENHFRAAFSMRDISQRNPNGKYLYKAIRKYGKINFSYKILGYCLSLKELNQAEIECIDFYKTFGSDGETFDTIYGYNCTKGGDGGNGLSQEAEQRRILNIKTTYNLPNMHEKLSKRSKGKNNGMFGKNHSLESKTKMRQTMQKTKCHALERNGRYIKMSQDTINEILDFYTNQRIGCRGIEKKLKIPFNRIKRILVENNVPLRNQSEAMKGKIPWNKSK